MSDNRNLNRRHERARCRPRGPAGAALIVGFGLALSTALGAAGAEADARSAHVCLGKTDRTGGELGFVVPAEDAPIFIRAGFSEIACPASFDKAAASLVARCERFQAMDPVGKEMLADLYGLSVEQMCASTHRFARTRAGE